MTAITWPTNPSDQRQVHTANGISWKWDGTSWNRQGGSIAEEITEGVLALRPTQAQAEAATSSGLLATVQSVRQYVGYESSEITWKGFRTSTDATPAAGTWTDGIGQQSVPADAPLPPSHGGGGGRHRPQGHCGRLHPAIPVVGHFQAGVLPRRVGHPRVGIRHSRHSDASCGGDQQGDIQRRGRTRTSPSSDPLGALGRAVAGTSRTSEATIRSRWTRPSATSRGRAGTTEYSEDWELDVFCTSVVSVIDTRMSGVTGWVNSSGTKVGHARVQWSTDNGSTWISSEEMTNIYNSQHRDQLPDWRGLPDQTRACRPREGPLAVAARKQCDLVDGQIAVIRQRGIKETEMSASYNKSDRGHLGERPLGGGSCRRCSGSTSA